MRASCSWRPSCPSGLLLRGYVDRLDVAPAGQVRVVDYKTGAAPRPVAETRALFQMKFYALMLLLPARRGARTSCGCSTSPTASRSPTSPRRLELRRFERTLDAIWAAILASGATGDFRPNPSRFCEWCGHRAVCPAWGGTPPAYPGWPGDPVEETPADRAG